MLSLVQEEEGKNKWIQSMRVVLIGQIVHVNHKNWYGWPRIKSYQRIFKIMFGKDTKKTVIDISVSKKWWFLKIIKIIIRELCTLERLQVLKKLKRT